MHPARRIKEGRDRARQQRLRRAKELIPRPTASVALNSTGGAPAPGTSTAPRRSVRKKRQPVGRARTQPVRSNPTGGGRPPSRRVPPRNNPPRRLSWSQQMQQPFDPLSTPYKTQGDFERTVDARAQQAYQPYMTDLDAQAREAESAHLGRREDIGKYYGGWEQSVQRAFGDTNTALQGLLSTHQTGSQATQQSLADILRASDAAGTDRAAQVGATAPTSQSPQVNMGALGLPSAAGTSLAQIFGAMTNAAAQRQSLPALNAISASNDENQRYRQVSGSLADQRARLTSQIPGYEDTARQELYQQALAGQNQGFQQDIARRQFGLASQNQGFQQTIAERQFGLAKQNQGFQQRLAGQQFGLQERQFGLAQQQFGLENLKFQHAKNIDWANVSLQGRQLQEESRRFDAELQQAIQAGADDRAIAQLRQRAEQAKGKAVRYDSAVNGLAGYLQMSRWEERKPRRRYKRYFDDALRLLQGQYKLDYKEALTLLSSTTFQSWQNKAQRLLRGGLDTRVSDPAPGRRGGR